MRRALDGREADAVQLRLRRADAGGHLPDGLDVAVVELLLEARPALERVCTVSESTRSPTHRAGTSCTAAEVGW